MSFEQFEDGHLGDHNERNDFKISNSESLCCPSASHQVSAQSTYDSGGGRKCEKLTDDGRVRDGRTTDNRSSIGRH